MSKKSPYINSERYKVLEATVDVNVQLEFYTAIRRKDQDTQDIPFTEEDLIQNESLLYNPFSDEKVKKMALLSLANGKDVSSYRVIERFVTSDKSESVRDWAMLAKSYAQMVLDNELSSQKTMYVSSGLGGKENKLRYLVVFVAKNGKEFTESQKRLMQNEFKFLLPQFGGEFESLFSFEKYAVMKCLAMVDPDVRQIVQNVHEQCNKIGNFVDDNYVVTNVKDLSLEEIELFLEHNTLPNIGLKK